MIQPAYDIVVVGAGPAGAIAARMAAEAGMETLLIEKRLEIGTPVRCGESFELHTASHYLDDIPNQPWVNTITKYFSIHNTRGDCVVVPPISPSIIADRKIFDREVAYTAAAAGAQVLVNTRAEGLLFDDEGTVVGVKINCMGARQDVYCKVVIAADGTESQVARWAGLKSIPALERPLHRHAIPRQRLTRANPYGYLALLRGGGVGAGRLCLGIPEERRHRQYRNRHQRRPRRRHKRPGSPRALHTATLPEGTQRAWASYRRHTRHGRLEAPGGQRRDGRGRRSAPG